MDQQTLLTVMTVFVVIAGISLLLQLVTLLGLYRTAKSFETSVNSVLPKVHELLPKVNQLVESSTKTVEQSRQQILEITTKTNEVLEVTKRQLGTIDSLLTDAAGRAKVQLEHAEMVLDDTMSRAHETVAVVQTGIIKPLREIQGVAAGIRTAIAFLARGSRPNVSQATHDEEMFI